MRTLEIEEVHAVSGGEVGATGMGDNYHYTGSPGVGATDAANFCGTVSGLGGFAAGSLFTGACLLLTGPAGAYACGAAGSAVGVAAQIAISNDCNSSLSSQTGGGGDDSGGDGSGGGVSAEGSMSVDFNGSWYVPGPFIIEVDRS